MQKIGAWVGGRQLFAWEDPSGVSLKCQAKSNALEIKVKVQFKFKFAWDDPTGIRLKSQEKLNAK